MSNLSLTSHLPRDAPPRLIAYAATLALSAALLAVALASTGWELGSLWVVLGLGAVAAVAERGSVRISSDTEESISLLPTLFVAVLFGPLAGLVVGALSNLGDFRRPYLKWVVYTATRALGGAAAGLVATGADLLHVGQLGSIALAATGGAITLTALDLSFSMLTFRFKSNGDPREVLRTLAPVVLPTVPLWTPVVALLAFAYQEVSAWTLPLFIVPTLAAHRSFVLYQEQRQLAQQLSMANDQLEQANLSFAAALVATLDARDRYTAGHSAAVAIYSRDIAARMGLDESEQRRAHLCGLVHDIGKVGLPAGLLEKPGPLTLDERRQMQEHSTIGQRILANVQDYSAIALIVRHHHERVDGQGYPDGLEGSEIPLLSRIIAVADAYNAMTSDRPYRDAMPSRVARLRLAQAVESQFDTTVVAAFEALLAAADEGYRAGTSPAFMFHAQQQAYEAESDPSIADVA